MREKVKIMIAVVLLAVLVVGLPYLYSIQHVEKETVNTAVEDTVEKTEVAVEKERPMQAVRIVKTAEMPLYNVGQRVTNKKYVAGLYAEMVNDSTVEATVKTDMPVETVLVQIVHPDTKEIVYEGPIGVSYGKSGDNDTYHISFNRYVFKDPEIWGENVKPDVRFCKYPVRLVLQSGYDSSVIIYAN